MSVNLHVPLVRDATLCDLPEVVRIYNQAISGRKAVADTEPISLESRVEWFRAHSSNPNRPFWILEIAGQVAAWISLQSYSPHSAFKRSAEVSLFVDDEFQGKGYGTFLLSRLIARCSDLGVEALMGVCFAGNEKVIALNQRLGLQHWGRLRQVADIRGELRDLIIMGINFNERGSTVEA